MQQYKFDMPDYYLYAANEREMAQIEYNNRIFFGYIKNEEDKKYSSLITNDADLVELFMRKLMEISSVSYLPLFYKGNEFNILIKFLQEKNKFVILKNIIVEEISEIEELSNKFRIQFSFQNIEKFG